MHEPRDGPSNTHVCAAHSQRICAWRVCLAALCLVLPLGAAPPATAQDVQPAFPIRAAFYYPWFPEAWHQHGIEPYTKYTPSLGYYNGSDPTNIRAHIAAMQYGDIQAGIASWWGQGSATDGRLPALLANTDGAFRWSIYYEAESLRNPSVSELQADLTYLHDRYGQDPAFLRIDGRFVVFVYSDGADSCEMATRWAQANTVNAYIVLKVFAGYRSCSDQPASWHQYGPAGAASAQLPYSYTISPGFDKVAEPTRLRRDLIRWQANVRAMAESGAAFQLITTFNEWGEGTAVESAAEWASASGYGAYLDTLHRNGQPPTFSHQSALPAVQTRP